MENKEDKKVIRNPLIRLRQVTKDILDTLKVDVRETYDSVITKLLVNRGKQ